MHKILDFVCDELEDIEKKAEKGGLSMSEVQYADVLARLKKNILKSEQIEGETEYSMRGYTSRTMPTYYGNSYAGRRRDRMGRYSGYDGYSRTEDMVSQLRAMMENAPNEMTRQDIQRLVTKLENQ